MNRPVKQRLTEFAKTKEKSVRAFEIAVGLTIGYINAIRVSIHPDKLQSIASQYPDLNTEWLLTGKGEMLKDDTSQRQVEQNLMRIPLLPIAAQGGSLNEFIISVEYDDCEKVISPIKDVDFAMPVIGDSMDPEYPRGSKILIKRIKEDAFIEWGRVYVLDTCNGSIIKRLMPGKSTDVVECQSINPQYPSFEVGFVDIYGIYRVLMLISEK